MAHLLAAFLLPDRLTRQRLGGLFELFTDR